MQHSLSLVNEEQGIYECSKCERRGKKHEFYDICNGTKTFQSSGGLNTIFRDSINTLTTITEKLDGPLDAA